MTFSLDTIRQLVQQDFDNVNTHIKENLHIQLNLIHELSDHIISSGGKRLRPLVLLLSAKAHGYTGNIHVALAAAIEYFHTATLLHDDVIDESKLRRGQETANVIWGSKASILVGDYLFIQAFQTSIICQDLAILKVLVDTADTITRGEVQQLLNCHNADTTETQYFEVIRNKTAILFSAAAQVGAMLGKKTSAEVDAMASYGLHLGNAFQLVDDLLDYSGEEHTLGKHLGDDLAEGKLTLPLIYALKHAPQAEQKVIRDTIQRGNLDALSQIIATLHATGALEYTQEIAKQQAAAACNALSIIPSSIYKEALLQLAEFAVARKY